MLGTKGIVWAVGFLLVAVNAFAQDTAGTLTYGPVAAAPTPVPLPTLFVVVMGVAAALLGLRYISKHGASQSLGLLLLVSGSVALVASGTQIREAMAATTVIPLDQPDGGTVNIPTGFFELKNTSGAPLRISGLSVEEACSSSRPDNACEKGMTLPVNASCSAEYRCIYYESLLETYHDLVALRASLEAVELLQGPPGEQGPRGQKGDPGEEGGVGGSDLSDEELLAVNQILFEIFAELDLADRWLTDIELANDTLVRRSNETQALYDLLKAELNKLQGNP